MFHLDYPILTNLHALLNNQLVFWNRDTLYLCSIAGLVLPSGDKLTPKGREIAQQFGRYVALLEKGIPLNARFPQPLRAYDERPWKKAEFDKLKIATRVVFTRDFLYCGVPRGNERQPATMLDRSVVPDFQEEIVNYLRDRVDQVLKFDPFAYQVFQGHEAIVLRPQRKKMVVRIDPMYFDLCEQRYAAPTYWVGTGGIDTPVLVKVHKRGGMKRNISAIIKPIDGRGWPHVDLSVFESECEPVNGGTVSPENLVWPRKKEGYVQKGDGEESECECGIEGEDGETDIEVTDMETGEDLNGTDNLF